MAEKTVEDFIKSQEKWSEMLKTLRGIIKNTRMDESMKWGMPTYSLNGKNLVTLAAFKNHISIWFHQGVFLKDEHNLLSASSDETKGMRKMDLKDEGDIDEKIIERYLNEAIRNQEEGREIKSEKRSLAIPAKLESIFETDEKLKEAFEALSHGKQVEYAEFINGAKQEKTKGNRLEKIIPMIKEGVGLNDKYK